MNFIKKLFLRIDQVIEGFAITMLLSLILIVVMQVMTRKLFNFVFYWSEEVTLLFLVWFCFIGIAIGVREKIHLAMDMIEAFVPKIVIKITDKMIDISTFGFGIYCIFAGWKWVQLGSDYTMAATRWPNSIEYIVIPLTGILLCAYSFLQFLGCDIRRYTHINEEITRHGD